MKIRYLPLAFLVAFAWSGCAGLDDDDSSASGDDDSTEQADTQLHSDPASVDFGSVEIGSTSTVEVTLTNDMPWVIYVVELTIEGHDSFTIDDSATERIMAPETETTVQLGFQPTEPGEVKATAHIVGYGEGPDWQLEIPLSGEGIAAQ